MTEGYEQDHEAVPAGKIKIVCQACGARYLVRDDRVRGRRFRATCKRCGEAIVAKVDNGSKVLQDSSFIEVSAAGVPAGEAGDAGDEQWYIVREGKPRGPVTARELRERVLSGQYSPRTYAWRPGVASWQRLFNIAEFADAIAAAEKGSVDHVDGFSDVDATAAAVRVSISGGSDFTADDEFGNRADDEFGNRADNTEQTPLPERRSSFAEQEPYSEELEPFEAEVTRLHPARIVEEAPPPKLSFDNRRAPQNWGRGGDSVFGPLPGKIAPDEWAGQATAHYDRSPLERRNSEQIRANSGLWAPVSRRPAVLPLPSRARRELATVPPGMEGLPPMPPASAPPVRQPAPGGFGGGTPMGVHQQQAPMPQPLAAQPAFAAAAPMPVAPPPLAPLQPVPAGPKPPEQTNAGRDSLAWLPNPTPLGPSVQPAPQLGLLKPQKRPFWTKGKIVAASVGGGLLLAAVTVVIVLLVVDRGPPPPGEPASDQLDPVQVAAAKRMAEPPGRASLPASRTPAAAETGGATGASPDRTATRVAVKTEVRPVKKKPAKARRATRRRASRRPARRSSSRRRRRSGGDAVDADALLGVAKRRARRSSSSSAVDADDLLAAGGGAAGGSRPQHLSKAQVRRGMNGLRSRVRSCFDKHRVPGTLRIRTTIRPSGQASGSVVGDFAGTPTAACVVGGVANLSFPSFAGSPMQFVYPFTLR